jgi:ABC-type multidrug transport system ATPase subunit
MTWGMEAAVVRFGSTLALDGVTLEVPAGRVVCVIGGDGAGKSSLLRVMAGVLHPDRGRVERPDRRNVGYMPATSGVYIDLSVDENLEFSGSGYGLSLHQVREHSAELLDRTGLAEFTDRPAGDLSGGMRQKLGAVCAVLHRPQLLVLDEPTTGVDPVSRADLWWLIASCVAEGAAVLVRTHVREAERASRVVLLEDGRTLASGTPAEVIAATPGHVSSVGGQPARADKDRSWRRGSTWRIWDPNPPRQGTGGEAIDLQDAVTVAELAAELERSAASSKEHA